ncbi:MAG TPA: carboxypeptidase regulatory-like domain-containing protein [Anaeromyxobacteraceae bacterium]|nr:carboxypeptidase regulatory-like domain-containing protein [Anaeromyxobacteraceae bacterium]
MSSIRNTFAAALAAAVLPAAVRAEAITGAVEFTGTPPPMAKLDRGADPFCAKKPMNDESVVVKDKKLVNVWVHVVKGAPDSKAADNAPEVVVDQVDCTYHPRMQVAQVGQKIVAKNGDPILHNVHTYLGAATVFNKGMPNAQAKPVTHVANKEGVIRWKCDVHAWMRAFVGVNKNPFQAVSGGDGGFRIDNIPPGTYTLEAWHEKYGAKTLEVKVEAGKPATATFKYDGTEKGS